VFIPSSPIVPQDARPARLGETDDAYPAIYAEPTLRIIRCKDDIQWIAQLRLGGRWRSKSFHRSWTSLHERYRKLHDIPITCPTSH
jgi:hypothetical protein